MSGPTVGINFPEELLRAIAVELANELERRGLVAAPAQPRSPFVDVDQAAELLCASRQRVYDLVHAGKLVRRGDGRRLLLRRDDVIAYVDGGAA